MKLTIVCGASLMLMAGLSACNGGATYQSDTAEASTADATSNSHPTYQLPPSSDDGDTLGDTGDTGASGVSGPSGANDATGATGSTAPTGTTEVPPSVPAIQIAAGSAHACALLDNGTVRCWGDNSWGELGNGSLISSSTPVVVKNLTGITSIAAGGHHTCALASSGLVYCWGMNAYGQVGKGSTSQYESTPVQVTNLSGVKSISVATGGYHSCAVTAAGAVKCWGNNSFGQLGLGLGGLYIWIPYSAGPVQVKNLTSGVDSVVAGYDHTCAVIGGGVECWGANDVGQLGNQLTTSKVVDSPVQVISGVWKFFTLTYGIPLGGIKQLASGVFHTCALNQNGNVLCWGKNAYGELGRTSVASSNVPTSVVGVNGLGALDSVKSIASGSYHSCAVLAYGQVRCWGAGQMGQLGDSRSDSSAVPTSVLTSDGSSYLGDVTQVVAGRAFTCVLTADHGVSCFGANDSGQLGASGVDESSLPMDPIPFPDVKVSGVNVAVSSLASATSLSASLGRIYLQPSTPISPIGPGPVEQIQLRY